MNGHFLTYVEHIFKQFVHDMFTTKKTRGKQTHPPIIKAHCFRSSPNLSWQKHDHRFTNLTCLENLKRFAPKKICPFILLVAEIRRSPVEVGSLSHYLQGFIHPRWWRISSINRCSLCTPCKTNEFPLKINGWKMHFPIEIVPFLGDIR